MGTELMKEESGSRVTREGSLRCQRHMRMPLTDLQSLNYCGNNTKADNISIINTLINY